MALIVYEGYAFGPQEKVNLPGGQSVLLTPGEPVEVSREDAVALILASGGAVRLAKSSKKTKSKGDPK